MFRFRKKNTSTANIDTREPKAITSRNAAIPASTNHKEEWAKSEESSFLSDQAGSRTPCWTKSQHMRGAVPLSISLADRHTARESPFYCLSRHPD